MSRGFCCALFGIAITIFAWWGAWAWPAWPGLILLDTIFSPQRPFSALPSQARVAVVAMLISVNVSFWAMIAWASLRLLDRTRLARRGG